MILHIYFFASFQNQARERSVTFRIYLFHERQLLGPSVASCQRDKY